MVSDDLPVVHVVAAALTRQQGGARELLVTQRAAGRRHGGLWELPGGKVEPGESEEEALVRELAEELSVAVELADRLGEATVPAGPVRVRMAVFWGRVVSGELRLVDHDAAEWVQAGQPRRLAWAPADVPFIEKLEQWLQG